MNSLFSENIDFLKQIEVASGKDKRESFSKIYSSLKIDASMLDEVRKFTL